MDTLSRIYDMAYCELDDIAKKDKLDSKDVELIDKFVDIIKDIDEINGELDGSYSRMGGSSYDSSYVRGRSNRMMPMYRGSSYGRSGGYSRSDNREVVIDHLQDVADMVTDEKDRKAIERLMTQMAER